MQKFNRKETAINRYAQDNNIEFVAEFEENVSEENFIDRQEWQKLENLLRDGDTIIFKDISDFTREPEVGSKQYMALLDKGIELIFINDPIVSTPYLKRLLNVVKKQNILGRPVRGHTVNLANTVKLLLNIHYALELSKDHSYTQVEALTGISKSTLIRIKSEGELNEL